MNKGLKALQDINYICDRIDFHRKHFLGNVDEDWIEKRIKQKSSIIEKELKALEIIRKVKWVFDEDFSKKSCFVYGKAPKEEYELLKEVLKNDK